MRDKNVKTSHLMNALAPVEVGEINPITPLAQRSMFWRPNYLDQSRWLEHVPFAFWLVEAQRPRLLVELGANNGTAYFAFCQGINRLGLNTRCFAVDTWKDNEQTFDKLNSYNDTQYSGFSRLVRSTFNEALSNFGDGSIDMLNIGVQHNYETIKQILEAWLPKLSQSAVVTLHGTNVREGNAGIYKYFEEFKNQYPWFEFSHGQGLGILGVGKVQNKTLNRLFGMSANEASAQVVCEVFSRLGRACTDSLESRNYQIKTTELTAQLTNQNKVRTELQLSLEETRKDLVSRKQETIEVKAKLQSQIEQHAAERGQLNERVNLLQEIRQELKTEVERLQGRVETAFVRLAEKGQELNRLALESAEFQRQIYTLGEQSKDHETKLAEKERALIEYKAHAEQIELALQESGNSNAQLAQALAEKEQSLKEACAGIQQLEQALQETRSSNDHLTQIVAEKERALVEYAANVEQFWQELQESRNSNARLTQALAENDQTLSLNEQALHDAQASNDHLTQIVAEKERALVEYAANVEQFWQELQESRNSNARLTQALAEKDHALNEKNAQVNQTIDSLNEQNRQLEGKLSARFDELAVLTKMVESQLAELTAQKELVAKLDAENRNYAEEKAALTAKLNERYDELAVLTNLLAGRDALLRMKTREIENEKQRTSLLKNSVSWKVTAPVRVLARALKLADKTTRSFNEKIKLIEQSGLFDSRWYLEQYPDVANTKMKPVEHYLKHGAEEGRNPGPHFDTAWYLNAYQDVKQAGVNPLAHFIKIGKQEGRQPLPQLR